MEKGGIRAASQEAHQRLQRSDVVCRPLAGEKPGAKSHLIPFGLGQTEAKPGSRDAKP